MKPRKRRRAGAPSAQADRPRSQYWAVKHDGEEGHPVDVVVDRSVQHRAARRTLIDLQDQVLAALANHEAGKEALLALEELRNEVADEREQAYFNLGYEHGLADKHARERRRGSTLSKEAREIAVETRQRFVRAKLPPWQAMLCLLECAWSLAATESRCTES